MVCLQAFLGRAIAVVYIMVPVALTSEDEIPPDQDRANETIYLEMKEPGHRYFLGELYDCSRDEPIGGGVWPLHVTRNPQYVDETNAAKADYSYSFGDSLQDRLNLMNIKGEITFSSGLGINTGSVKVQGSYLKDERISEKEARALSCLLCLLRCFIYESWIVEMYNDVYYVCVCMN